MWRARFQSTGPQEMPDEAGRSVVVVVILNLLVREIEEKLCNDSDRELAQPLFSSGFMAKEGLEAN
jgi:hypothetical protein